MLTVLEFPVGKYRGIPLNDWCIRYVFRLLSGLFKLPYLVQEQHHLSTFLKCIPSFPSDDVLLSIQSFMSIR